MERAGDWILEGVIASGGFGSVFRAHHPEGRRAAVKVLHAELAARPETAKRFLREVEAVRRIDHPAVIDIYEAGEVQGLPWYAMELLEGADLMNRLNAHGRLPADEALAILTPLCEALSRAHAVGVIHRDVKASNVFLARDGRVVLLDFGVAKLLDAELTALTQSRQMVGTPSCMAPEQIAGGRASACTDVYALGGLVYQMLTGEPCFGDETATMLSWLHLHARRPRPSRRVPLAPAVDDVVVRAMSIDPEGRQAGPLELLEELRGALAGPAEVAASARSDDTLAAAVHVEVTAAGDLLDAPDDALLADLEAIVPHAAAVLSPRGFRLAFEAGTSALFLGSGLETLDEAARALRHALEGRRGRDDRLEVTVKAASGKVGSLLRLDWA